MSINAENIFGKNVGSPCNTAKFLLNSLKIAGRFSSNSGIKDINWIVPRSNHDASIVWPVNISKIILPSKKTIAKPVNRAKIIETTLAAD